MTGAALVTGQPASGDACSSQVRGEHPQVRTRPQVDTRSLPRLRVSGRGAVGYGAVKGRRARRKSPGVYLGSRPGVYLFPNAQRVWYNQGVLGMHLGHRPCGKRLGSV